MVKNRILRHSILRRFQDPEHEHQRCVQQALAAAEAKCLAEGMRLTTIRRRVLELIWGSHEPVKAYDLLDQLRAEDRRAAPPTVYRALNFLLETGLVHKIESQNAYVGCGQPKQLHSSQFLICKDCGSVAELGDPQISELLAAKARQLGFKVDRECIEIAGLCSGCSGRQSQGVGGRSRSCPD
ncbi:MAG: Fur family transcriptional regulator [Gammaproteobacteria bacterium]